MKKGPFKMKGMTFKESPAKISESELLRAAKSESLARTSAKVQKGMADSRKTHLFGLQAGLKGLQSYMGAGGKFGQGKKKKKPEKEKVDTSKLKAEEVKTYDMDEKQIEERPIVTEDPNEKEGQLDIITDGMGSSLDLYSPPTQMRKQDFVFPMKYGRRKKKK
tara:strand:- start:1040 stop:1528 length:489 start_codon:yes stop_codon:yes gene_type:complete